MIRKFEKNDINPVMQIWKLINLYQKNIGKIIIIM